MSPDNAMIDTLSTISTATLTTVLLQKGLRNVWLRARRRCFSGNPADQVFLTSASEPTETLGEPPSPDHGQTARGQIISGSGKQSALYGGSCRVHALAPALYQDLSSMAGKTNYDFERRERERAKLAKKEAKTREKAAAQPAAPVDQAGDPADQSSDLPAQAE